MDILTKKDFLADASVEKLQAWCAGNGLPAFRARQIVGWLREKLVFEPEKMGNLPVSLRRELADFFHAPASRVAEKVAASDGTVKLRILLADGESVETVLIPTPDRLTFCLSTQVGCPVGCRFCASGEFGLTRNLRCGEILEEFLLSAREAGRKPDNVVFMGIGEGLLNFDEFARALEILSAPAPDGFGFAPRRITVSTSGFVPGMLRFAGLKKEYNLAVSLHAVDDATRAVLIPDPLRYPVKEILAAADSYRDASGRQYTIEYTLVAGVNDSPEAARALGKMASEHHAKINLIPLNRARGDFRRPDRRTIESFEKEVAATGARVTRRAERGLKRGAACGQLRSESLTKGQRDE
ncbi:MAG: 23S rRNA (adenine(2503)-C(2))-methyltransferase RlmN [Victivallaceae bacterium]|nr:23S rRNA (adenine(2503)-C(2))-methyltransferase RlmN [Victivallaceae bacterium]